MTLHPDLAALVPRRAFAHGEMPTSFSDLELTAFALTVARAERERCAEHLDQLFHRGNNFPHLNGGDIRALPDPDWTATP